MAGKINLLCCGVCMKENVTIKQVLEETDETERKKLYNQYVKQTTPTFSWVANTCRAFLVGGFICLIGEALNQLFQSFDLDKKTAGYWTTLILVAAAIILTGLGWYSKLAKFAGAGSVVPITGFANSVASPAVEFRAEGQVFGIGCKIFTIAGPVILYGVFASWLLGLIYWLGKLLGLF